MAKSPDVATKHDFEKAYQGRPPWDIDGPQPALVKQAHLVTGRVLDAGCGTGENALFFAARGHEVWGIDFLEAPLVQARKKAEGKRGKIRFEIADALELSTWQDRFETVIDCGLFHVFSDRDRQRYVEGLRHVLRPGGRLLLLCFSDREPGDHGPRRITRDELRAVFAAGFEPGQLSAARFDVRPDMQGQSFSAGGPQAWFGWFTRC